MNKHISFFFLISLSWFSVCAEATKVTIVTERPDPAAITYFLSLKAAYEQLTGHYSNATTTYTHLRQRLPSDLILAKAELKLLFEQHRYADVIARHTETIDPKIPDNKESLFIIAQSYFLSHKNSAAIKLFSDLIHAYPLDDRLVYFKAIAQTKNNQGTDAAETIEAALAQPAFASKHYLFHFLKGQAALASNDLASAKQELTIATTQNPSFAQGFFLQGTLEEKQGYHHSALANLERAIALNPADKTIVPRLINLAIKTGAYSKAQQILATHPSTTVSYFYDKTMLHMANKEYADAVTTIHEGLIQHPCCIPLKELMVTILMAQGKGKELITTITSWLVATPTNSELIKAITDMRNKKIPGTMVTRAIKVAAKKTGSWLICCAYANLLDEQNKEIKAQRWYRTALKDTSMPPEERTKLSNALKKNEVALHDLQPPC